MANSYSTEAGRQSIDAMTDFAYALFSNLDVLITRPVQLAESIVQRLTGGFGLFL